MSPDPAKTSCPACAEPVEESAPRCPACGERLAGERTTEPARVPGALRFLGVSISVFHLVFAALLVNEALKPGWFTDLMLILAVGFLLLAGLGLALFRGMRWAVVCVCVLTAVTFAMGLWTLGVDGDDEGWGVLAVAVFLYAPAGVQGVTHWEALGSAGPESPGG